MKLLAAALIFATALSAQRGGGGRAGGGGGGFRGGGGGGFRGGGAGMSTGYRGPTMGRPGIGVGRPGVGIGHPGVGTGHPWGGAGRPWIGYRPGVGYRLPVYSSYYGYGYGYYPYSSYYPFGWGLSSSYYDPYIPGYGYASTLGYGSSYDSSGPNVSIVTVPTAQQPPVYIVNQAPYQTAAPAEERPLATKSWAYIIATKSGTVWVAREYSVHNGNVQLTTTAGETTTIPLSEIDRDTTEELNRERGVTIQLEQPLRQ